jgi:hypothetical protein
MSLAGTVTWLYLPAPFFVPFFIRFFDHEGELGILNRVKQLEEVSPDDIVDTGNIFKKEI